MSVMKVLIVDDHLLFRQGLASLLRSEPDIDVCGEAGTLEEAIKMVSALSPNIVLMDYGLPDGNGADATRSILAKKPDCVVLFLTVHAGDDELFSAIRSGATGFLLKNEPIDKLLEAIRSVYQGNIALSMDMTKRILKEFSQTNPNGHKKLASISSLTPRELQVLRELAAGATNREIAETLVLSENTIKRHVHSIFAKLNLTNRREAAQVAHEAGLI